MPRIYSRGDQRRWAPTHLRKGEDQGETLRRGASSSFSSLSSIITASTRLPEADAHCERRDGGPARHCTAQALILLPKDGLEGFQLLQLLLGCPKASGY